LAQNGSDRAFVADMMLGGLVRWMRILGFDVLYFNPVSDPELIRVSLDLHRVLLTRDTRLVKRRGLPEHVLVRGNAPLIQLKEVACRYSPDPGKMLTRCIRCNVLLERTQVEAVRDDVPEYVLVNELEFSRCPDCGRIYWRGSHVRRMIETCTRVLREIGQGG